MERVLENLEAARDAEAAGLEALGSIIDEH
jgi:hypothetical protein